MKQQINEFIHTLVIYDYILFGAAIFLFILFLVLAIALRNKLGLSLFIMLIAFLTLILLPTLGYINMHKFLYKTDIKIYQIKKLEFTPAIVVNGNYTNMSNLNFSTCKVSAHVFKVAKDELLASLKNKIFPFNPFIKETIVLDKMLKPNESNDYKLIIEPFYYKKDYNISVGVSCR